MSVALRPNTTDPLDDLFDAPTPSVAAPRRSVTPRRKPAQAMGAVEPRRADWRGMADFTERQGFTVTSTTAGPHNPGSAHYAGRAIDVRTRDKAPEQVADFITQAQAAGYAVRDERTRPAGQAEWTGPHIHLEAATRPRRVADAAAADPIADLFDAPSAEAPAPEDEEVVKIDAQVPDLWTEAPAPKGAARALPSINSAEGQAIRDRNLETEQAPDARRTMGVQLPPGLGDWSEASPSDVAKQAARQFAAERGIDPQFTEEWLNTRGGNLHIYDLTSGQELRPVDLLATEHYDSEARTIRVSQELPILKRLEADYKNSGNVVQRAIDWATDPQRAAGEKFLDVAQPVAGAVARGVDLAQRPLSAVDAAAWSMIRNGATAGSPAIGPADIYAATQALQGEQVPEYAKNPVGEAVRDSETLAGINPNLPGLLGAGAEMLTSPSNVIAGGAAKAVGPVLRGTRAGAAVSDALNAAGDARFTRRGRILNIEGAAPKPRLRMATAEGITGEGLEVGRQTRRVFKDGVPQPFVMNGRGSVVRSPLPRTGRKIAAAAARQNEAGFVDVGEIAKGVRSALKPQNLLDVANAPRALMGSADLSAPLRQGAILTLTEPAATTRAARSMVRSFVSRKKYETIVADIAAHPESQLAERSGLYIASRYEPRTLPNGVKITPKLNVREEAFMSRLAGKFPWVRNSERAYVAYLDRLRMDSFARYADEIRGAGLTPEQTQKSLADVARFVNYATGRGDIPDFGKHGAPLLNAAFFSPRLVASRFQILSPTTYLSMEPAARKIAMRKVAQFGGTVGMTLALARASGAEVSLDPESPDFLKIKVGNTRYDFLAGLQQPVRFLYGLGRGLKRSLSGEKQPYGQSAAEVTTHFLRSKLSPSGSYVADAWTGKTFKGEDFEPLGHLMDDQGKFNPGGGIVERVIPMMARDLVEAYQQEGLTGVAKTAPAFVGVGVSTYDEGGQQRRGRRANANASGTAATHNARVRAEAKRLLASVDADKSLTAEQKKTAKASVSRRLSAVRLRGNDQRGLAEVEADFATALSDIEQNWADLIEQAKQR